MIDGASTTNLSRFYLHTKGFNFNDSYLLAGMLHYQFSLKCTVKNNKEHPFLYITSKSIVFIY